MGESETETMKAIQRYSKRQLSQVAQRIATALAEHAARSPLTLDVTGKIVQEEMQHLWKRDIAHRRVRTQMQRMVSEVFKLTGTKIKYGCPYYSPDIGCDVTIFKFHIERQFTPEMNWQNYADIWEIDHIKPLRDFDLTLKRDYLACSSFRNLRPLLRHENRQWSTLKPVTPLSPRFFPYL